MNLALFNVLNHKASIKRKAMDMQINPRSFLHSCIRRGMICGARQLEPRNSESPNWDSEYVPAPDPQAQRRHDPPDSNS